MQKNTLKPSSGSSHGWLEHIISPTVAAVGISEQEQRKLTLALVEAIVQQLDDQSIDRLATTKEAASYLSTTARFLECSRVNGTGPKFVKLSANIVRYRLGDLRDWVEQRLKSSTGEG